MRFSTQATIYKIEKVKDGQGGYTEEKTLYKEIYCHISNLKIEKQIQLFGVVNYESLKLVTMENIDLDNFYVLVDDTYYKSLHKPRVVKNKTYLTLDVLDHAN